MLAINSTELKPVGRKDRDQEASIQSDKSVVDCLGSDRIYLLSGIVVFSDSFIRDLKFGFGVHLSASIQTKFVFFIDNYSWINFTS